jgi:uncharacterized protein
MQNLFLIIFNFFEKRKILLAATMLALFAVTGFFASKIKVEEDISKILPHDKTVEQINFVFDNARFLDKLIVAVSLNDTSIPAQPELLIAYADSFSQQLQNLSGNRIIQIKSAVDDDLFLDIYNVVHRHLPMYLEENDYRKIDSLLEENTIRTTLENNYRTLLSPAGIITKKMIADDPVGITGIALQRLQNMQWNDDFEIYDGHVFSKDRKHLLVFIYPSNPPNETSENSLLLDDIDNVIAALQKNDFPDIDADYFGTAAIAVGNARQIKKDAQLTLSITFILLFLFTAYFFRRKRTPFVIMLPVIFGALFSLTMVYFIQREISAIALGAGAVILGIAINYALHVFSHYRHTQNIKTVVAELSLPMLIGCFTTVGAFFILQFVQSEILHDLGLFAGFCLIGAALFTLLFLPHLVEDVKAEKTLHHTPTFLDKIAAYQPEKNYFLIAAIFILTVFFLFFIKDVRFETDMNKLSFMSKKLRQSEAHINKLNESALKSVFLVSTGKNMEEALQHSEMLNKQLDTLKNDSVVRKYSSVSSLLISEKLQQERIERWNNYWSIDKKEKLKNTLLAEGSRLKFKPSAFDNFYGLLEKEFAPATATELSEAANDLTDEYLIQTPEQSAVITLAQVYAPDKRKIYDRFPKNEHTLILDKQYITNQFVHIISSDFNLILAYSSSLVFLSLLIAYGRMELALLTFIPMAISWVWILGIMGLFGIKFNLINIIISTFIFGLGDDFVIFITDGLTQKFKQGKKLLPSFKTSNLLAALTVMISLGVLIFARHPALQSIALISLIGLFCVLLISQTLIPFLYKIFISGRAEKGKAPYTLKGFLFSFFAFTYFVTGCLVLTLIGYIILYLVPAPKKQRKYVFHFLLSWFVWSLVYVMFNAKKKFINRQYADFSKPSVIICNHQSFLDILVTVMLHPKLVLLTNKWVYHSPFFGKVVQLADYYYVAEGAENSVEKLQSIVDAGYSIVVFPEGTRSVDGTMKRFHKGAFYIAEQLQLDIQPLVLHGTGHRMAKGDFQLMDGQMTLKFLPRITPDDKSFGENYSERTKQIGKYFRDEYEKLKQEIETPEYFLNKLFRNYIYKGPVLEWYVKVKVRMEGNYALYHQLIPRQCTITDLGCGYGYADYMLHFLSSGRKISAIDFDADKIETANHCYSKNDNIHFIHADISEYAMQPSDVFILNDVLHYLEPEKQKTVLTRCIEKLNAGGIILIKEADKANEQKHFMTRLSEFFSNNFGFNKNDGTGLHFVKAESIKNILAAYNVTIEIAEESKLTSNLIFVVRKNVA